MLTAVEISAVMAEEKASCDVELSKPRRVGVCLLWFFVAVYIITFTRHTVGYYDRFAYLGFDLGVFSQATWLISQGKTPWLTVRGMHAFGDHFSLILYFIAPLYRLFPTPKTLLIIQVTACAIGAVPLYYFALNRTKSVLTALCFALAYLLNPLLQVACCEEFHPDTLMIPGFLAAIYFMEKQHWGLYFACIFIVLITKEIAGFTVIALGLYAYFRNRWVGTGTILTGIAGILTAFAVIRHFNSGQPSAYLAFYAKYGNNPLEIVLFTITHPLTILADINTGWAGAYLLTLLIPVAFLACFAPEKLVIALPSIVINLIFSRLTVVVYYSAPVLPFLLGASMIGFTRCCHFTNRYAPYPKYLLLYYLLQFTLIATLFYRPINRFQFEQMEKPEIIRKALASIPGNAVVSASAEFVPHLSGRSRVYVYPNPFYDAGSGNGAQAIQNYQYHDYPPFVHEQIQEKHSRSEIEFIMLGADSIMILSDEMKLKCYSETLINPDFGIVVLEKRIIVLRRNADHARGLQLLHAYTQAESMDETAIKNSIDQWIHQRLP